MKRESSVTRNCRLLCPVCAGELRQVIEVNEIISLECGHTRPEILPLLAGRVSVENIRTAAGRRLFPAQRDDVAPAWVDLRERKWR
jgi:hypothetical protein